tara:strand:+ start:408 stop:845 length:438 start_codon:yes stop_codon:yes gene_type:complete
MSNLNLRRFISDNASEGKPFVVKLSGDVTIAKGEWITVNDDFFKIKVDGKINLIIKEINFSCTAIIKKEGNGAKIILSGDANTTGTGDLQQESADELKILNLSFDDERFNQITEISLTRWKNVETRASIYKNPILQNGWLQTWWV